MFNKNIYLTISDHDLYRVKVVVRGYSDDKDSHQQPVSNSGENVADTE